MSTVEIKTTRLGTASVLLDGTDVASAARRLTLTMEAGELPRLELDLALHETGFAGEDVVVVVPDGTRETLKSLGWTEPDEDAT